MADYSDPTEPTREELSLRINTLEREVERLNRYVRMHGDLSIQIGNVEGYIKDQYDINGELSEDLTEVASLLGIELTKEISGTFSLEVSWTATVPLGFDAGDMQISYSLECESYDAEDFDFNEDSMEVSGEDS